MDLLSEGTSNGRVLAARHISAGKSLPEQNEAVNATFLCHSYSLQPDFDTYYRALQPYTWVLWAFGLLTFFIICTFCGATLRTAYKYWTQCFTSVVIVLVLYPIVTASALVSIMVPRAQVVAEAIAQQAVMVAMYHLFQIFIAECGGKEDFVRRSAGSHLETRVLPCCCWPCCALPRPKIQKKTVTNLSYIILQMPIIQALIYSVILVLWAEDMTLYIKTLPFIQPFIAASILLGVWGVIMTVRATEAVGVRVKPRFLAVQLTLLIVKLQCGVVRFLGEKLTLPCVVALHPTVFVSVIQNCVMIFEMLLLSIWAWRLYTTSQEKTLDKVQKVVVAVLDDSFITEGKKDGLDNKSYK